MKDKVLKFWPYRPRTSFFVAIAVFISLLIGIIALKMTIDWPGEDSEDLLLMAAILISVFPVLFAIIDVLVERGGSIEYQGAKINFTVDVDEEKTFGFKVPENIADPGAPLSTSRIENILKVLKIATTSDAVVLDLKQGNAWWETRLLLLLAGAVRHNKPKKIVFTGAAPNGIEQAFLYWGYPSELLPALLEKDSQYSILYDKSKAAARQQGLIEPGEDGIQPDDVSFMQKTALNHQYMANDPNSRMPNKLYAEEVFASLLKEEIEKEWTPKTVTKASLIEIFGSSLKNRAIDISWESDRQLEALFESDVEQVAITQKEKYKGLVSKVSLLSEVVKELTKKGE